MKQYKGESYIVIGTLSLRFLAEVFKKGLLTYITANEAIIQC